jgi:hypothetical protein
MTNPSGDAVKPKVPPKTLVVGSSGHAHVTCVAWPSLRSVNLKDFDAVVVNVTSLDDKTIKQLPRYKFFNEIRKEMSLLLASSGSIIALAPERRGVKHGDDWRNNWEWCPIGIWTQSEAGDTIQMKNTPFGRYLSKFKRWTFYFFIPDAALSTELTDVFGPAYNTEYRLPIESYALNRYGKTLAGEVSLLVGSYGHGRKYGSLTLLPAIAELEQKEAINLILEDLLGKPQQALPPEWISQISMPFVDGLNAEIANKHAAIEALRQEIDVNKRRRAEIEKWKKLVYTTGKELEQIFEEAVITLGANTKPASAEEEFILEHNGHAAMVECKGVGKSISLEHVRQADSHVLKFVENENREGKGILFGNAFRNLPPGERGKAGIAVFPDNVVKHATQREIALVGASDFLEAFCRFLKGELPGAAILDAMMTQNGIVNFRSG